MDRLEAILQAIDTYNATDPRRDVEGGTEVPRELSYSRRMSAQLAQLEPSASDELRIAVRAQHIGRWKIERSAYPEGRQGYKRWRSDLAALHADITADLMARAGYDDRACNRVRMLLQKRDLSSDTEVQTLEDCACLVFIEHYLADFATKHPQDKLIGIIGKTWKKMSARARERALLLPLDERVRGLIEAALAG